MKTFNPTLQFPFVIICLLALVLQSLALAFSLWSGSVAAAPVSTSPSILICSK
ncbi:hypothetical protein [Lignipirellula cremea]|uniref:Uncharacterized protein n=1 Tax=Lignipirellula cremea TaxID=2528010 RepID=A0A518DSK3_9BACT|nr:hypothetical protein [Lignipirellula cremea]QDU94820.1 hypothetical protein Pla8534_26280 [Lignipirellula cremea]